MVLKHVKIAPYHPVSNGMVEKTVNIVLSGLTEIKSSALAMKLARVLFKYQTTPRTLFKKFESQDPHPLFNSTNIWLKEHFKVR